jgi:hemerythrin-like domain-containing protein
MSEVEDGEPAEGEEGTMKPIGPLMWEHRLIEQMVGLLRGEIDRSASMNAVNLPLIEQAVDFFRTYADRTHHGKEEEILFRELARKELSSGHRAIMEELIREHVHGRGLVSQVVEAKDLYAAGDAGAMPRIVGLLRELVDFYPGHIEKEDKRFFFPCLDYFSDAEQEHMLAEFFAFDQEMIHEKYHTMVEHFLGKKVPRPPRPL